MEDTVYLTYLYDYYGELLTEKQKTYFEEYYFNNLSLLEISENYSVSRNAIHKQLKESCLKLRKYENTLEFYKKNKKIKELVEKVSDDTLKNQLLELL